LEVVAEGVETDEVWTALGALGCEMAQDFYLSRPLPTKDLEHWLHAATTPTGLVRMTGSACGKGILAEPYPSPSIP